VGRTFLAPGDTVVVGLPSYLGALGAFTAAGARLTGIPLDDDGMPPDLLEEHLIELRRTGVRPKLLYLVPDFQNPDGSALPLARRLELLAIAREFDLLVVEDSPYRQLRFEGETLPSMASLDRDERVIGLYTFSKILSPGLRLGWILANPAIINQMVTVRQAMDLCTSPFSQMVVREFLRTGQLPALIERTRTLYARKRRAFLDALGEHIDPAWGVRWTKPHGGMFLWMRLPSHLRSIDLLHRALEENVAFVVGTAFHCDGGGQSSLRLNFSYPSLEQLVVGAQRLARAIEGLVRTTALPASVEEALPPAPVTVANGEHSFAHLPWNLALTEVVA
jgi:2-aminoadipate transaminase